MSTFRTLTMIASIGVLALIGAESVNAALPPGMEQVLGAKPEFDGWWEFRTTVNPAPVVPGAQGVPPELSDLNGNLDGNTMRGNVFLLFELQQNGGRLSGSYRNVREPAEKEEDEEREQSGAVNGVVRNRSNTSEGKRDESTAQDPNDVAAAAAAAAALAAELKKLERDVVMVVVVDIPDEDEDIVMRYRGTQFKTDMKGTVELGKRNKDGKFEKAGDGTFVARKMN